MGNRQPQPHAAFFKANCWRKQALLRQLRQSRATVFDRNRHPVFFDVRPSPNPPPLPRRLRRVLEQIRQHSFQ